MNSIKIHCMDSQRISKHIIILKSVHMLENQWEAERQSRTPSDHLLLPPGVPMEMLGCAESTAQWGLEPMRNKRDPEGGRKEEGQGGTGVQGKERARD